MNAPQPPIVQPASPIPSAPAAAPVVDVFSSADPFVTEILAEAPKAPVVEDEAPGVKKAKKMFSKEEPELAPPVFQNGRLVMQTPTAAAATAEQEQAESKTEKSAPGKKKKGISPIWLILPLVVILAMGVSIFFLQQDQQTQILALREAGAQKDNQIISLNNQLTQANDLLLTQQKLPVYVDNAGTFSFLQEIPGLRTVKNDSDDTVNVYYGEADADVLLNGFSMSLVDKSTNGLALAAVAENAYNDSQGGTVTNSDFRTEIIGDMVGYSFVRQGSAGQQIIYFLQKNTDSPNYIEVAYQIKTTTQDEYTTFEKVVFRILNSLKIY
ncbi:MAG: hypothetical protein Q4G02_01935 [bacterium]|nr:hypothetical protein [bacterium]